MLLHRTLCVCMQLCGVCRQYPTGDYVPRVYRYHHSKAHYSSSAYDTTHLCDTIHSTCAYITIYVAFWLTCAGNIFYNNTQSAVGTCVHITHIQSITGNHPTCIRCPCSVACCSWLTNNNTFSTHPQSFCSDRWVILFCSVLYCGLLYIYIYAVANWLQLSKCILKLETIISSYVQWQFKLFELTYIAQSW